MGEAGLDQQESCLEQAPSTDDVQACSLLSKIHLAENFCLIPEIGIIDQCHDTTAIRKPEPSITGLNGESFFEHSLGFDQQNPSSDPPFFKCLFFLNLKPAHHLIKLACQTHRKTFPIPLWVRKPQPQPTRLPWRGWDR